MKGRYSPADCIGARKERVEGNPDPRHVSVSYANAFSKKVENHMHMVALYTVFYNWRRIHKTLWVTPAMEARVADRLRTMEEIAELVEAAAPKPGRPATYKKSPLAAEPETGA